MRAVALAIVAISGLIAVPTTAPASPIIPTDALAAAAAASPEILQVRDGCGRGYHLRRWQDRWGRWHRRCVPYRRWDRHGDRRWYRPPPPPYYYYGPRGGYYR
jgi:hypothetical protein